MVKPKLSPWMMMTLCGICLRDGATGATGFSQSPETCDDAGMCWWWWWCWWWRWWQWQCLCQWLCTLLSVMRARSQMAGFLRDSACGPFQPAWGFCGLGRLPTKVTVSRTGDGSGNEFNISAADSCTLIVVPVKQIEHIQWERERLRVYLDDSQVIVSTPLPFFFFFFTI